MNRKNLKRTKAIFGESIAAAGIQAAATLAGAATQAVAAKQAAKTQADATTQQAQIQADSLLKQNENAQQLQQQSMEFTKAQNEENRQLQKDAQMTLQLMAGQKNTEERQEANKITVRNGGKTSKRKLRNTPSYTSLRGSDFGFRVTDGGGAVPVGYTPEGYPIFEVVGDTHEESHKTKNGKRATGVGFKFTNGQVIEAEGRGKHNQGVNPGEVMVLTPDDALFYSRHTRDGFNAAQEILAGAPARDTYNTQALLNTIDGTGNPTMVRCGGRANSPVKRSRRLSGGNVYPIQSAAYMPLPDLSTDTSTINMAAAINANNDIEKVKCGGRAKLACGGRRKAAAGDWLTANRADMIGAGLNSFGNLLGAGIATWGNNRAARILGNAYTNAGNILADAYGRMHGIDMSALRKEDYRAAHVMPALQSTVVDTSHSDQLNRRNALAAKQAIGNTTNSAAARLARYRQIENDAQNNASQISSEAKAYSLKRATENMNALNEAAKINAELDTQANSQYASQYLNLLQYNNDIENDKISGAAQAKANALMGSQNALASAKQQNAAAWASGIQSVGNAFGTAMSSIAKRENDWDMALVGKDADSIILAEAARGNDGRRRLSNLRQILASDPNPSEETIKRIQWINSILNNKNTKEYPNGLLNDYNGLMKTIGNKTYDFNGGGFA